MLKQYNQFIGGLLRLMDSCVIGGAWLLSYWLRFNLPLIEVTKGFPAFSTYSALLPVVIFLWLVIFSALNIYQTRRLLRRTHEAHQVLRGHLAAMLLFIAITYLFSEYKYSRGVMLYFGIVGGISLVACRLAFRNALRAIRRKGYKLHDTLLVGEGPALETLIHRTEKFPELGFRIVGVVAPRSSKVSEIRGCPVLGHYGMGPSEVPAVLAKTGAKMVIISLPRSQSQELDPILADLREETVDIQIVPDIYDYVTLGCAVEDFDGLPIVNLNDSPLYGWGALAKRVTDFALSTIALILLSPVFAVIALLVKLTSRGPVFYFQERMSLDGRTFRMYKFRSMRQDAEAVSGAVWAKAGDDRRTPIGKFLRASNLDEIPQLWNVLTGDMSLVGPRPERPVFVDQFRHQIPNYMLRHKVKTGLTGWAQVNGWRGNTSLERRIECDLFYIRNWSYGMDWKIMLLTLGRSFWDKNAY